MQLLGSHWASQQLYLSYYLGVPLYSKGKDLGGMCCMGKRDSTSELDKAIKAGYCVKELQITVS